MSIQQIPLPAKDAVRFFLCLFLFR
uniref:Uncharacterized protein n=1 Tax=Rhizophora mucronata TaxID=61149 RepID=A0A2P2Q105_RHIMU